MSPTDPPDPVAEAIRQLHQSGWSVGIVPFRARDRSRAWVVIGRKDGTRLVARGQTPLEAWLRAVEQARSLGMLDP